MKTIPLIVVLLAPLGIAQPAAQITKAFNVYVAEAEARIAQQRSSTQTFLSLDALPAERRAEVLERLRRGEVVIERQVTGRFASGSSAPLHISGGLIHDWVGLVFIPGATVGQALALVQDYDHMTRYYSPDVLYSRLISRSGDEMQVSMRMQKHKLVTIVLDSEYEVHYGRIDASHQFSVSRSTRVTEIADAGSAKEHGLDDDHDHGFMWRLNSYWAFQQSKGGVYVECEAISLTRDIPAGAGWLIGPFVNSIPRESLDFTLSRTRAALSKAAQPESAGSR